MDPRYDTQPLVARMLSSIFKPKCAWPDPEASVGEFIRMMGGKMCWRATGPALNAFTRFSKDIEEYLDKFGDALPETVLRTPCMIGSKKKNSRPTVIFSSSDQEARKKAQKSIQESGILQKEGFYSMTCNRPPEFPTLMALTMDDTESTAPGSSSAHRITLQSPVGGAFGVQVLIFDVTGNRETSVTATGGGILEWKERYFLMTAAHAFQSSEEKSLFIDNISEDFEYDFEGCDFSDEDEYEYNDDEMPDLTSRGSKTSEEDGSDTQISMSPDISSTSSSSLPARSLPKSVKRTLQIDSPADLTTRTRYTSTASDSSSLPIRQLPSAPTAGDYANNGALCSLEGPFATSIAGLSPLLDYALIEITGHRVEAGNVSLLPESEDAPILEQNVPADIKGPSDIIALTACKGSIKGRLTGIPSFGTAPNSTASQELWTIQLDGKLEKGDCGCWVVDAASGAVYGQIIAGSPGTGFGLIAPLKHILSDLIQQFGGDWKIAPRSGIYSRLDPTSNLGQISSKGPSERAILVPTLPSKHALRTDRFGAFGSRITPMSEYDTMSTSSTLASVLSSGLSATWRSSSPASSISSLSMSTSGSGTTWLSLLDEKRHEVTECFGQDYRVPQDISSGRTFRDAFEKFARRKGDYRYSKLEAILFPSMTRISELSRLVDQSTAELQPLAPNKSLEGLVWWILYAIIESGCSAGAQLTPLVYLIAELNMKVPRFTTKIGGYLRLRFPNEERVRQPLQDVYSLFIDSLVFIISYLKKRDPSESILRSKSKKIAHVHPTVELNRDLNRDPTKAKALATHIAKIARRFEEARGRFDVMVSQTAEDEERKETALEQPRLDVQRTLPDYLHHNSNSNREVQVRFVSIRSLGNGSFGEVDEVRESSTGASYARKHIHLDSDKPPDVIADEVKNEVAIMQKLRHLHIATVLFYLKEEEAYSIFMLPVAEYDLQKFLSMCTEQDFPAALIKSIYPWFGCLLDALAYAHKLMIRHQDIKPSNILIKNNQPYLCDFGLAKDLTDMDASTAQGYKVRGNRLYRAPEVVPNQVRGRKADVFSLGCVYSEMFTITQEKTLKEYREYREHGHETGEGEYRDCIGKVEAWLMKFERNGLGTLLVDEILCMIKKDTAERHSAEQAMHYLKPERALFCVE